MEEGLSQQTARCIYQDRQGYLWFGTQDGLNRYDGQSFVVYRNQPNKPESLPNNSIAALLEDSRGVFWVATTGGGVAAFEPNSGRFQRYPIGDKNAKALLEDREGRLWVATQFGGLHRYSQNGFQPYPLPGIEISHFVENPDGQFTVSTRNSGLYVFNPGNGQYTALAHQPASPNVYTLFRAANGALYAGTARGVSVQREANAPFESLKIVAHHVTAITAGPDRSLWFGGENGLTRVPPSGPAEHFGHDAADPASLSSPDVQSLLVDRAGTLWVGAGRGLNHFNPARLRFGLVNRGLRDSSIRAIHETAEGTIYLGSRQGLDRLTPPAPILSGATVFAIAEAPQKTLYLASSRGLLQINPATGARLRSLVPEDIIYTVVATPAEVWFGGRGGLYHFVPATKQLRHWRNDPADANSLAGNDIRALALAPDGRIWIGTRLYGLDLYDPATNCFRHYRHAATNPNSLSGDAIFSLHLSPGGPLWVGTTTGLNRLDLQTGAVRRYTTLEGLPNDTIYTILPAAPHEIWLSTNLGLSRLNTATGAIQNYDRSHGLQGNEFNGGAAFAAESSGYLYFGGTYGFNRFRPEAITASAYSPPVVLTGFRKLGQPVAEFDPARPLSLSYRDPMIGFSFASLDYSAARPLRYGYRLEGFDTDWRYTTQPLATYTNLNAGKYTFRVRGTNADGVWSQQEAAIQLTITPPWYEEWWFRTAIGAVVLGAAIGFYRLRSARFQREQATREAFSRLLLASQEAERKKIAADLHDSLGQNLIVIRNHALLGLTREAATASPHLQEIANAASLAIDEVREIATNLRPQQLERLGLASAIQAAVNRAAAASNIRFHRSLALLNGALGEGDEIHVYRIVQESLNNILKHSEATEASVIATRDEGLIRLQITDNGRGFEVATSTGNGLGLSSLAERARILKARYHLRSAPGQGTVILLEIPEKHERSTHSCSDCR